MNGKEDDDDSDDSPFMSQHFPDAKPLRQPQKHAASLTGRARKKPAYRAQQDSTDIPPLRIAGNSDITAGTELRYQGDGVQNRVMQKLQRGQFIIDARLDLHGQNVEQAHISTMQFLNDASNSGLRCVLVIHGQGYRSASGIPVLKQNIDTWLRRHAAVLAFHSALPADGGKGAVYVLLRKKGRAGL